MQVLRNYSTRAGIAGLAVASVMAFTTMLSPSVVTMAQEAEAPPLVAMPVGQSQASYQGQIDAFLRGMTELGYVEGENIRYEFRFGDGNPDRYAPNAEELVALGPAVIIAAGTQTPAVAAATSTIPIVIGFASAATMSAVVQDFEHPEGNITGQLSPPAGIGATFPLARELLPNWLAR